MRLKKRQSWPFIREREYSNGRKTWQVDARTKSGGQRKEFDTKIEAETFALQQRVKRENEGSDAFAMTPAERIDAENAMKLLRPLGKTLVEAVRFYHSHLPTIESKKTIEEVV